MRDANMLILLSFEYNYFKNKSIVNNSDDQITQVINMFLKASSISEIPVSIFKLNYSKAKILKLQIFKV